MTVRRRYSTRGPAAPAAASPVPAGVAAVAVPAGPTVPAVDPQSAPVPSGSAAGRPTCLLRVGAVATRVGLSVSEVWRRSRSGEMPSPVVLGPRETRWVSDEIDAYIALLIEAARMERAS